MLAKNIIDLKKVLRYIYQSSLGGCTGVSKVIDVENGTQDIIVDSEDSEPESIVSLRSLSALDFREHAKDLFYAVYQAQKDYKGDIG